MWRVIDLINSGYYVHVKNKNILIEHKEKGLIKVPFAEVNSIISTSKGNTFSGAFLEGCLEHSIPVIFCDEKYLPQGMLLPSNQHMDTFQRMKVQIEAKLPRKKKAWQLIIREKILNQSKVLYENKLAEGFNLKVMASQILSGDSTNIEAQGARLYFDALFGEDFTRADESLINGLLNYGYTIIRSMVARAVVARGLNPAFGIFHSARINPFCLVDDLMEPIRPFVDRIVKRLLTTGSLKVEDMSLYKNDLIGLITSEVFFEEKKQELNNATLLYVTSYLEFLSGKNDFIKFPIFINYGNRKV